MVYALDVLHQGGRHILLSVLLLANPATDFNLHITNSISHIAEHH